MCALFHYIVHKTSVSPWLIRHPCTCVQHMHTYCTCLLQHTDANRVKTHLLLLPLLLLTLRSWRCLADLSSCLRAGDVTKRGEQWGLVRGVWAGARRKWEFEWEGGWESGEESEEEEAERRCRVRPRRSEDRSSTLWEELRLLFGLSTQVTKNGRWVPSKLLPWLMF